MKLWQKNYALHPKVDEYCNSEDVAIDQKLVEYDCLGSIAHAKMLKKLGYISASEFKKLEKELEKIIELDKKGKFKITVKDEDVHTKIENHLTKKLGAVGKKIHFARSRNDQVLVCVRLFTKEQLKEVKKKTLKLIKELKKQSKKSSNVLMPGFTHTRKAMPYTIDKWLQAFAEALKDDLKILELAYKLNDQSPLGSAAGFGVNVDIDRNFTSKELGFKKVQKNTLYVQNSRGKIEAGVLFALSEIMLTLNKLSCDLILFSCSEFGYLELPKEFCTGSSIMPQKKNPDPLELVRANHHKMQSYLTLCMNVSADLMSGFHRDLQLTKEAVVKGLELCDASVEIVGLIVQKIKINESVCNMACTDEIFATNKVNELVLAGMPFREAYKKVAEEAGY